MNQKTKEWPYADHTDEALKGVMEDLALVQLELEVKLKGITKMREGVSRELDMREIAGSHEELKAFRARMKLGTVTGRMSSAAPNIGNVPRHAKPLVHALRNGLPVCGFTNSLPKDWPPGHAFVPFGVDPSVGLGPGEKDNFAKCSGCYGPKNFFLNEAHELPPIKKSELRKQNKMRRDAKKAGKKWCSICLTGPCGLWEHADKGSDFCRRHK